MAQTELEGEALSDELAAIVQRAAAAAADSVARAHRRRLVVQAFLAALAAAAIIAIPVSIVISHSEAATNRKNTGFNCRLFTNVADVVSDFVNTDATDRASALTASQKRLVVQRLSRITALKVLAKISAKQNELDAATITHWTQVDVAQLQDLANTNCSR